MCQVVWRAIYLCLISKQLERHWIWYLEGQGTKIKCCAVKLEVYPDLLHSEPPFQEEAVVIFRSTLLSCSVSWEADNETNWQRILQPLEKASITGQP